jgi:anaerobic ribonucleoside-triphosphate reductase
MTRYKCYRCSIVLDRDDLENGLCCPECHTNEQLREMCPEDHCNCGHDVSETISYCRVCGEAVCPVCGCHDVVQISRVTGYLQEVGGWNMGKAQELKDRTRVYIAVKDKKDGDIVDEQISQIY